MSLRIEPLTGAALDSALDDVARLRIAVFRDWPYLYDGDLDYERRYLDVYRRSTAAILVGAFDGPRLVGAATGTPMEDHVSDFARAFAATGPKLSEIFYCAESVLLPTYRGQGVGHRFFDLRESHAHALDRGYVAFCAVMRPPDHPACPPGYRPLDGFWQARGYREMPGVQAEFLWKDLGEPEETVKSLQFWIRPLST